MEKIEYCNIRHGRTEPLVLVKMKIEKVYDGNGYNTNVKNKRTNFEGKSSVVP